MVNCFVRDLRNVIIHSKYFFVSDWLQNGGTFPSFQKEEVISELLAKNIARTARRQLDGRHLLFGEYLQTWETLLLYFMPKVKHDFQVSNQEISFGNVYMIQNSWQTLLLSIVIHVKRLNYQLNAVLWTGCNSNSVAITQWNKDTHGKLN